MTLATVCSGTIFSLLVPVYNFGAVASSLVLTVDFFRIWSSAQPEERRHMSILGTICVVTSGALIWPFVLVLDFGLIARVFLGRR